MESTAAESTTRSSSSVTHAIGGLKTLCVLLLLVTAGTAARGADKSAAAIENSHVFIPASAHVSGALGTNWRTDLEIYNPGQAQASVTVALLKAGTSNHNPETRSYPLNPGEALRFEDALMSVFGFDGAAAIRVVNTSGMAAVTSRTYNLTGDGTYGQFVGGVISHTAIQTGQEGRIIQLTHNRSTTSGFRTNIGFVNVTVSQITVQVALYRADGVYLGAKSYPLEPFEFKQVDKIFQKVVSGDVDDGYAVLTTSTAGGAFFAYGVVIDNRTSDPVYITPANRASGSPPPPTPTPTTTPSTTPSPTPTATPTPTETPTTVVNLAPYQPDGWSGPLVVAGTAGATTSGGLRAGSPTYFSWAVGNDGPDDAVIPAFQTAASIFIEGGVLAAVYYGTPLTIQAGHYATFEDGYQFNVPAGRRSVTLTVDPADKIGETDEDDNSFTYVGTWSSKSQLSNSQPMAVRVEIPRSKIRIAPIRGWRPGAAARRHDPINVLRQGSPPLYPGHLIFAHTKATAIDNAIYIPASAHATGALNTNWRTDVQLHNPGTVQARVDIAMLVRDQANPTPQTRTFVINAGTSMRLEDILASSFSFDGAAALRITILEGDVIATSRTYNLTSGGTFGQFGGTVHGSQAFVTSERALLMQLTHDASNTSGFRTNVGMVNLSNQTIVVDLDLRSASGTSYGTKAYTLRPYEFIQKDKIFKTVTSLTVSDGYVVITSATNGARFLAYATVIDNQTGDTVFIPGISVLAAEPTAATFIPAAEAAFGAMGLIGQGIIPSFESMIGMIQTVGMGAFIAAVADFLPPGVLTPLSTGWRTDLGSHFVAAQTGDILAGGITGIHTSLINQPGHLSFDYEITGENVLWNGHFAEIGGVTGEVDLAINDQGHVSGEVSMESFASPVRKDGQLTSNVTVTGSAEFDTEICPNYPISGSVTVTKDGESQTITFTSDCDGTFDDG